MGIAGQNRYSLKCNKRFNFPSGAFWLCEQFGISTNGFTLIWGLKRLFGSRPKFYIGMLVSALVVAAIGFAARQYFDPHQKIVVGDQAWNRQNYSEAVKNYQDVLQARDPFLSGGGWVTQGRGRLYQRLVLFKSQYYSKTQAQDWARPAVDEGITDLSCSSAESQQIWESVSGRNY